MRRGILTWMGFALVASLVGIVAVAQADERADLLQVREQVWRAWWHTDSEKSAK
jgi:hypothetical protein